MRHPWSLFVPGAAGVAGLLFLAGCLSTHPGSSSLAYVEVDVGDADTIREEAVRVFGDDNYLQVGGKTGDLVFEREATQRDKVLFGQYGDADLVMRVVVSIEPARKGGHLVRADAYIVRDGVEEKLTWMAKRPYQDLLNRVKANFVTASGDE